MRVCVHPHTQVNFEGQVYEEGRELEVPGPLASKWIEAGWVCEAKTKRRAPHTARNKARGK